MSILLRPTPSFSVVVTALVFCFGLSLGPASSSASEPPMLLGGDFDVTTAGGVQELQVMAALNDGTIIVVWESDATGNEDIVMRRFAADGTALGSEVTVNSTTSGDQEDPAVAALAAGGFVVVWDSGPTGDRDVFGRLFANDLTPTGLQFAVSLDSTPDHNDPVVAPLGGSDFVVAWEVDAGAPNNEDIVAREFTTARGPSSVFPVNQTVLDDQEDASIASDALGNYTIAWESGDDSNDSIWARSFSPVRGATGDEFAVSTALTGLQENCQIAMHPDGRFIIVYENDTTPEWSIFARFFAADGAPVDDPFQVDRANRPTLEPKVAMDGAGRAIIVWDRLQAGLPPTSDVIMTAVSADETFAGAEFVVNAASGEDEFAAAIAIGQAGGIVTWIGQCNVPGCAVDLDGRAFTLPIFSDGFESGDLTAW